MNQLKKVKYEMHQQIVKSKLQDIENKIQEREKQFSTLAPLHDGQDANEALKQAAMERRFLATAGVITNTIIINPQSIEHKGFTKREALSKKRDS